MKAISLFSGVGGDTLGMTRAGVEVVAFSENNRHAIETHRANFPHSTLLEYKGSTDIRDIPDEVLGEYKVDIIFAGFPCQGFSHAGKKNPRDPRNELVYEFVRATRCIQPTYIIGENVKGLLERKTPQGLPVIHIIEQLFSEIGYILTWRVCNAVDFGVPQKRERLILLGAKTRVEWSPVLHFVPQSPYFLTLRDCIEPTLEGAVEYKGDPTGITWLRIDKNIFPSGKPHPNLVRLLEGKRGLTPAERKNSDEKIVIEDKPLLSFGKRASSYHGEILNLDKPCKTIICSYQSCPRLFVGLTTGEKYYVRTLTIQELARIQGFPDDFNFHGSGIITQIGNAVPPPLVEGVLRKMILSQAKG